MSESQRKDELARLLAVVLENSTIIPFRWFLHEYKCFYCNCPFLESSKLKAHMKEEHQNFKVTRVIRSLLKSCRIKLDISDIRCRLCRKKMHTFENFLNHISKDHGFKFNKEISRCVFTFKLNDKLLSCCDCGEKYTFFSSLLRHVYKYHNRLSKFLCEICGQGFVAKANVDCHVRSVHVLSPIVCSKCGETFKSLSVLQNHEDLVHKNKLECPKCPEVLGSIYLKRRHLALVHDVKKFQFWCDQCPQIFTRSSKLVHHKSTVHLKKKTVTCKVCGFKVFNNARLKYHMIKHDDSRPFECEFCEKSFKRNKNLVVHRRIHTKDKQCVCYVCGKAFVQMTSLKLHLKVHHSGHENSL